jgi:hypothetical protein|tara:strand:- start:2730 stop:2957 length:228 start_codon:yes stop_codon:yes gene_type:complete
MLHWLRFTIVSLGKTIRSDVPVMSKKHEHSDDFVGAHPNVVKRGTHIVEDKYPEAEEIRYIEEVFPYDLGGYKGI